MTNERTLPELVAGLQAEEAELPATAVDEEYCQRQQLLTRMAACAQDPALVDEVQDNLFRYVELVHSAVSDVEFARKAHRVKLAADALRVLQEIQPVPRRSFIERVDRVVSSYYKPKAA